MQLTDMISPRDRETIKHYIQLNTEIGEPAPFELVFRVWNKQKRTLWKLLGKKMRVSIPVNVPHNSQYYAQQLGGIYQIYSFWNENDARYFLDDLNRSRNYVQNEFVFEYLKFVAEQSWDFLDKKHASKIISHGNIEKGYINSLHDDNPYHFKGFKATIKNGMRTIRTIQKVLKAMRFPRMDLFKEWEAQVNLVNTNKDIKANLVFSIHPLDFMTMSDNACNWSSCMSWTKHGSYSGGTLEMMNSNMAIVAYLEAITPYNIQYQDEFYSIPNKSWRCLIFVNKYIMVAGKSYPYHNDELSQQCLTELRRLAKQNLNWDYQYINQPYRDCQNISNNFFLKYNPIQQFDRPKNKHRSKHAVYLYTNAMYNDIIEAKETYWCCRNRVERTLKFCISGPATCLCCGNYIEDPSYISGYEDVGNRKICNSCCTTYRCYVCNKIYYKEDFYRFEDWHFKQVCKKNNCLNNIVYMPSTQTYFFRSELDVKNYFNVIFLKEEVDYSQSQTKKFFNNLTYHYNIFSIINSYQKQCSDEYVKIYSIPASALNKIYADIPSKIEQLSYGIFLIPEKLCNYRVYFESLLQYVPAKEVLNEISSSSAVK